MFHLIFIFILSFSTPSFAKTFEILSINKNNHESMTFSPAYLNLNVGDEVIFIPKDSGHTSKSIFVPEGAANWASKTSERIKIVFNKEGLYIYDCANHGVMGMIGIIQVGNPINIEEAKKFAATHKKKIILNGEKLTKLIEKIKY